VKWYGNGDWKTKQRIYSTNSLLFFKVCKLYVNILILIDINQNGMEIGIQLFCYVVRIYSANSLLFLRSWKSKGNVKDTN